MPHRGRGRPPKQRAGAPCSDTINVPLPPSTSAVGSVQRRSDVILAGLQATTVILPSPAVSTKGPNRDYLLPAEALQNPNWGCDSPLQKQRGRPVKVSILPTEEQEDWLLDDDVDIEIGLGNEEIRYSQGNYSDASEETYFSTEEDSDNEGFEEDASIEVHKNTWPPEMLHAPSSSHKHRCKRKAPLWPELDFFTCESLADGEDGAIDPLDLGGLHLGYGIIRKGEHISALPEHYQARSVNYGHRHGEGESGTSMGEDWLPPTVEGGIEVGLGWD
jgi:hypothetical protein